MNQEILFDDLRRFIHTIPSVPYLEAMLLFRNEPTRLWKTDMMGQRLYMPEEQVAGLINNLCAARICAPVPEAPECYQYHPESERLDSLISCLADYYAKHIIEVTNMIHAQSSRDQRVQQFADAFKWRR